MNRAGRPRAPETARGVRSVALGHGRLHPVAAVVQTAWVRLLAAAGRGCGESAAILISCGDNHLPVGVPLQRSRDLAIVRALRRRPGLLPEPGRLERALRGGATIVYVTDGGTRMPIAGMRASCTPTRPPLASSGGCTADRRDRARRRALPARRRAPFLGSGGCPEGDPAGDGSDEHLAAVERHARHRDLDRRSDHRVPARRRPRYADRPRRSHATSHRAHARHRRDPRDRSRRSRGRRCRSRCCAVAGSGRLRIAPASRSPR